MFRVVLELHAVGQGLFYSGKLGSFDFVYDCGTTSNRIYLDQSVQSYLNTVTGNEIDLLILSHLHKDHTSGINSLLDRTRIKYVVLPYITPIERAILLASLNNVWSKSWYAEFLKDPIEYLLGENRDRVKKIVFITQGDNDGRMSRVREGEENHRENQENDDQVTIDDQSFQMQDDHRTSKVIEESEKEFQNFLGKILIKQHTGLLNLNKKWIFKFYNMPIARSILTSFEHCFNSLPGMNKGTVTSDDLKKLLAQPANLTKLRECYKFVNKDINYTSLLTYHGASTSRHALDCYSLYGPTPSYSYSINQIPYIQLKLTKQTSCSCFLTGDVDLKVGWTEMSRHFKFEFEDLSTVLVPHHGSPDSWNRDILKTACNAEVWYISAGLHNKYSHPSVKVIRDIRLANRNVLISNEFTSFAENYLLS